jgi:hypothetical protein
VCGGRQLQEYPPEHPYMVSHYGYFREPLRAALRGTRPAHLTAEEHTAQLSQRDAGRVYATTEEFELRFQDIALGEDNPPIDVLSCTTTMTSLSAPSAAMPCAPHLQRTEERLWLK